MTSLLSFISAQPNIRFSDSLKSNAEVTKLQLELGTLGKIRKFSFADYSITGDKRITASARHRQNFFNSKEKSTSTRSYSFLLSNSQFDSVDVHMIHNTVLSTEDRLVLDCSVFITTNNGYRLPIKTDTKKC